jgi:multiple sugar transport system ATP-binding protein
MNMVEATLEPSNGTLAAAVGSQRIVLGDEKLNAHPALRAFEGRMVILGIRPEDREDAALAPETAPLDPEPQNDAAVDAGSDKRKERR